MKTKFLFLPIGLAVMAASILMLFGCNNPLVESPKPTDPGMPLKSVTFSFVDHESVQPVCSYGYCDNDGSSKTLPERVDVFFLEPNHIYMCELRLSGSSSNGISETEILSESDYQFSFQPTGNFDLAINCPHENDPSKSRLCSIWKTGPEGNGYIKFTVYFSPVTNVSSTSFKEYEPAKPVKPRPVEVAYVYSPSFGEKSAKVPPAGSKSFEIKLPVVIQTIN